MPTNRRAYQIWQRLRGNNYMLMKIMYFNKSDRMSFRREIAQWVDILTDCQFIDMKRHIILSFRR